MGNRDLLLTNIGTAEILSVSHGTYPGEKNLRQVMQIVYIDSNDDGRGVTRAYI